ncbi:MAG TPA: radical SAM protein [Gemmatimonadales bacterium]
MRELRAVWMGTLRVTSAPVARQLELIGERRPTLPVLDQRGRGTSFVRLGVRSVLNSPASTGMGFWSINPYVGCEFGCTYCYARDTHRYVLERKGERSDAPAWLDFERRILIKTEVADVLARTLDPARLGGDTLVIGTATDPYQPAERRFRLTRAILERLQGYRGLSIGLITKSPLVTRDLDLLQALSTRHEVSVNISLATLDARLARRLELRSPVPRARIRALGRLARGGIHVGLLIAPIIPGLTDDREGLSRLMGAAKEAGARYVVGSALRLGPAARRRFLPVLAREFPELTARYERHYARSEGASPAYQAALRRRLEELQRVHGFSADEGRRRRRQLEGPAEHTAAAEPDQATLL